MEIQYYERRDKNTQMIEWINSIFCKIIKVSKNHITYVNLPTLDIKSHIKNINYYKVFFQIYEYNDIIGDALDFVENGECIINNKHFKKLTRKQFDKIYKRIDLQELKVDKNISDDEYLTNNDYKLYISYNKENYDINYINKNKILRTRKNLKNWLENVNK